MSSPSARSARPNGQASPCPPRSRSPDGTTATPLRQPDSPRSRNRYTTKASAAARSPSARPAPTQQTTAPSGKSSAAAAHASVRAVRVGRCSFSAPMVTSARWLIRALAPHGAVVGYDDWTRVEVRRALVLRRAPKESLRDPASLEHELLPRLGLSGSLPIAFPENMQPLLGTGLQPLQWPNQLAPYLVALSRYSISSYLEIGVLFGGTFILTTEYLARFASMRRAIAVDLVPTSALWRYRFLRRQARFVKMASGTPAFADRVREWRPGLGVIDGDHLYPGVAR